MRFGKKRQLSILVRVFGVLLLLLLPSSTIYAIDQTVISNIRILQDEYRFSFPIISSSEQGVFVHVDECNSYLPFEGYPMVPVFSVTYEMMPGTQILSVDVVPGDIQELLVGQPLVSVPKQIPIGTQPSIYTVNQDFYNSKEIYPIDWFSYSIGAGLNEKNEHVLFCTVQMYPTRYCPEPDMIYFASNFSVEIEYQTSSIQLSYANEYDLLIITTKEYISEIQSLIDHKNTSGIQTTTMTVEDISTSYSGRDLAEKMKYCIKEAVEQWNIFYVLLIGDVKKVPTRTTYASPWEPDLLSDLYFGDIYDASFSFCSWDLNANDRFGETEYLGGWPPQTQNIDGVDLYADVHVGRLPCTTIDEVTLVVDKIISYEETTDNSQWFKRIALAGGDTFPIGLGGFPFVYEGEITNQAVADELPDFEHIKLWASKHKLNAYTFNKAINDGVGFVTYAGHGFEHGWGTYRPNSLRRTMGFTQPLYYSPFIQSLSNQEKLPIIFFDACLTAKLDFNVTDLLQYYRDVMEFLIAIGKVNNDPSIFYPCFAWRFLTEEDGGAIATIGATRSAYTWVDSSGVYGGAGYLDLQFFKAYEEYRPVGMMLTQAQNNYINDVYRDYFTIEEYILIGDPSLRVGGFPVS
jgi:hypothetical protein